MSGISPNDFTATLGDLVAARTKEASAAGSRRAVMARFEKMGAHMPGLRLFLKLRDMEPADAEAMLSSALRYCRWAQLGIGEQASLFPASDDAGMPSDKARAGLADAAAFEEGHKAGMAGRKADDHRYPAGSPLAQWFYKGWCDGQAVLAERLGEPVPEDGSPLRPKVGRKKGAVEKVEAKPSGGRRRGRSSASSALDEARDHLG